MDETLKALAEQMAAIEKQIAESATELAPIEDELVSINAAEYQLREAFQKQINELAQKKYEINKKKDSNTSKTQNLTIDLWKIKQAITTAETEAAEKAKAEALAAAEAASYQALEKRFDNATIGAPWREWAKDHQIAAGHKIAQDRYVILADPMGLGKTLSSIVTTDMIEKSTKDVTPEFPFLGFTEEKFVPAQDKWTQKAIDQLPTGWPWNLSTFETWLSKVDGETPFDSPRYYLRNRLLEVGSLATSIPYDLKTKLYEGGFIENHPAHAEEVVVNAITHPVGRKILYFCPSPLLRNVLEEWRNWAPHRSALYIGGMSKAERNFALDSLKTLNEYVVICNYEAWRRDKALLERMGGMGFDTIIIDEAHSVKDMKSVSYQGVKQVIDDCEPEYVIPMTGTPILNRPEELYSILTLLRQKDFPATPQGLRDYLFKYCEEYVDDNGITRYKFRPGGLDTLSKRLSKNFMRRTKDQVGIDLPDKTIIYHELDLDTENYPRQAKARKHMKEYATIVLDAQKGKAIQATVKIALLTRLRQIETWPAGIIQRDKVTKEIILQLDVEESQKIDYIIRKETNGDWEGLIPDTVEDERIIVFSQFKAPLSELKSRVEAMGKRAVILDGSTPDSLRDEIRHDFDRKITPNRDDSKWDVLLANYKAAGVGLNLTAATQLITLDEEWNPGKRDQAWDRIHRIGQTEAITINVVRTKDTVDKWLADIIDEKANIVGGFDTAMGSLDIQSAIDSGLI